MSGHATHNSRDLGRSILRSMPVILAIAAATFFLGHGGWLRGFETGALDTMLRLKTPRRVPEIVIVGITEKDYREIFHARSPLALEPLQRVIAAIAAGKPKVIAIDLDTSSAEFASLVVGSSASIVWAQDAIRAEDGGVFEPVPVLGGREPAPVTGLALLPLDADGLVRRYRSSFETASGPKPALPEAVIRVWRRAPAGTPAHHEASRGEAHHEPEAHEAAAEHHEGGAHHDLFLNFAGDRFSFPRMTASDLLQASAGAAWSESGPLAGKIVVLGGLYRAARDEYPTPLGSMAGSEVMAHAIASELRGAGVRHASEVLMVILEILGGIALVVIHHRLEMRTAMFVTLLAIPVFALVSSFLAFSSLALWANFVPLLLGVLIHQLYDHAKEYRRLLAAARLTPSA